MDDAQSIESQVDRANDELTARTRELSHARKEVAARIEGSMARHLGDLGMSNAVVQLVTEPSDPTSVGGDRFHLAFSSDERSEPRPVGDIASGGELSRLVLAFRLGAASGEAKTLVFDEVDAGIGGKTALAMGEKLAALASSAQVLCVTHLPQVAARADRHYVVERPDSGDATVRLVEGDDRVATLATMMSGSGTEAGLEAARELLDFESK